MRNERFLFALFLGCSVLSQPGIAADRVPSHCPVTRPPDPAFVPPAPYPEKETGRFWLGTKALWTSLSEDGIWSGIVSPSGTRNKFWWWREGWRFDTDFRANEPGLIINARRIDGDASEVRAPRVTNAFEGKSSAMLLMLEIPTCGCWQITANYRSEYVSMVVWVPDKPMDDSGYLPSRVPSTD
jgi:hypothetical protein